MNCITKGCNYTADMGQALCAVCQVTGIPTLAPPTPLKSTIESTLAERGDRYGSFENHAKIAQNLQDVMRDVRAGVAWRNLAPDQRQALTVICDKIARMLNGDPNYRDNWHDIVGYAKLVDDRMLRDEQSKDKQCIGPTTEEMKQVMAFDAELLRSTGLK